MFYGSNVWDPVLIIAQIISVQCLFYLTLGLIQAVTIGPTLGYITVGYIFDWGTLHFSTKLGWLNWLSHLLNSLAGAAALAWIVERAKKCLDFGATCYIWHTIFVCWYSGWPKSGPWWLANTAGFLIMVLLGEWLCVRREMQDIPLNLHKWGSRKASGIMMPLPTEDPDLPAARPRLRTTAAAAAGQSAGGGGTSTAVAPAAAAAAASSSTSRPPSGLAVQMAALNSSSVTRDSLGGTGQRKKVLSRPASSGNMAVGAAVAAGAAASSSGRPSTAETGDNAV